MGYPCAWRCAGQDTVRGLQVARPAQGTDIGAGPTAGRTAAAAAGRGGPPSVACARAAETPGDEGPGHCIPAGQLGQASRLLHKLKCHPVTHADVIQLHGSAGSRHQQPGYPPVGDAISIRPTSAAQHQEFCSNCPWGSIDRTTSRNNCADGRLVRVVCAGDHAAQQLQPRLLEQPA